MDDQPGSRADFDLLYRETYQRVFRTLATILGDPAAAEDCTQDAFLKAYLAWPRRQGDRAAAMSGTRNPILGRRWASLLSNEPRRRLRPRSAAGPGAAARRTADAGAQPAGGAGRLQRGRGARRIDQQARSRRRRRGA